MMPGGFELPPDLADSVDVVYLDDEELTNLELDGIDDNPEPEPDEDNDYEPPEDKAAFTFKEHGRSVFCVNFSHDNSLVVTGGEDDNAYVFNVVSGEIALECTGHKDSVTAASFSHDNKYVCTGDMSGIIQVWDVSNKVLVWCYEGHEVEWLIWHHSAHVLLSGVNSGEIYMWQIPQGNCKVFPTSGSKCTCGVLMPNGTQIIAAYEDGCVKVWDLKSGQVVAQLSAENSGGPVTGLKLSADGKLLITCSSSGGSLILKTADCKIAAQVQSEEIESAAFCAENDLPILATGSLNGEICFWDVARQTLRHKTSIGYSVTNMIWGANAMLFISCVDGVVYVFSGRNGQLFTTLTGHQAAVLDVQLSKDQKFIATASDDTTAKIFDVDQCLRTINHS